MHDLHKSPQRGLAAAALSSHSLSAQTAGRTAERREDLIKVSQCVRDCPGAREVIQNADRVPLHHKDSYPTAPETDSCQDSLQTFQYVHTQVPYAKLPSICM